LEDTLVVDSEDGSLELVVEADLLDELDPIKKFFKLGLLRVVKESIK
jgi:hypothetical protein